ncbi:CDP-glycerol glycerophosphotransferase family protein [Halobacillus salinarum]|uniref:CDP-glycerol glycerophosphotransferase family protein n=1 Tax=Halobacillus salinarum TaxID=2932257 RepID=A0ABY4EIZ3_9BACI|nr:CDP-glycerol glycerophosphotransferase family protein [Halobacillus salinarum]UOQ44119.1 CDP-glycerol glycerophosphotransferase family protein [Halobacillus salinarum]
MDVYSKNKWSLEFDFMQAFSSMTYKGVPLVLLIRTYWFHRIEGVKEVLRNAKTLNSFQVKVLHRKQLQPEFEKIIRLGVKDKPYRKNNKGKIILYDELNLRFAPENYLQYFNSSTTEILRYEGNDESHQWLPIDYLTNYTIKTDILIKKFQTQARRIFSKYVSHPIFKLPSFQKHILDREIPEVMRYLTKIMVFLSKKPVSCIVIGGEGDYFSRTLAVAAKIKQIPTITLQHGMLSADRGWVPITSPIVGSYGNCERLFYQNAGIPANRIEIMGHPRYDGIFTNIPKKKAEVYKKLGLSVHKKTVLIATQYILDFNQLSALVKYLLEDNEIQIVIKPHPMELRTGKWKRYEGFKARYNTIRLIEDSSVLYDLMPNVDLVCVYYSTVGIEAMLYGTPVVYLNRNTFDGANYGFIRGLMQSDSLALSKIIFKLLRDEEYYQRIKLSIKKVIANIYPAQLSCAKLSELIYTMSGVRSYEIPKYLKNQTLIKGSDSSIFLMDEGFKREIPDPSLIQNLKINSTEVQQLPDKVMKKIPSGFVLYSVEQLGKLR